MGPELLYFDCSDEQFNCLMSTADVLAVPKAGLKMGQKYSVFGTNLTVERCFRDEATCEIAVHYFALCRCSKSAAAVPRETPGRVTTFYYSRDLGVTAFYTVADTSDIGVDAGRLADALPLLTFVLVAEKGFLRAPLVLRPSAGATQKEQNCPKP